MELEESHSRLQDVIFPGVAICSPNKIRKSFLQWISKSLNESGHHFLDKEISDLIKKAFLGGSKNPLTKRAQNLMTTLLNSNFFREYYWNFVREMNTSTIDTDGTTMMLREVPIQFHLKTQNPSIFILSVIEIIFMY